MRKVSAISRITLRVLFRNGGGWALLAITSVLMLAVFSISQSDGVLVNELQLRSRYALYFGNTVFSLALLWLACMSMRGDIDAKRMHLLTSYPLQRTRIYLGKWLGLLIYGLLGIVVMITTISIANLVMIANWKDADEKAALADSFWAVEREVRAEALDIDEVVTAALRDMEEAGDLADQTAAELADLRKEMEHQMRMNQQMIPKGNARRWTYEMGTVPLRRDTVRLQYRFYAQSDEKELTGSFRITSSVSPTAYTVPVSFYPRRTRSITFPTALVPDDGRVTVEFAGDPGTPTLLAYHGTGVRLYFEDRGYWTNVLNYAGIMLAHFAALIAVGLTLSTFFTLSIATFTSTVLYLLALTGDFFQRFLHEELGFGEPGPFEPLVRVIISFGLFFTTGLEQPAVIHNLTDSVSIGLDNLGMEITRSAGGVLLYPVKLASEDLYLQLYTGGIAGAIGFCAYLGAIMLIGSWMLRRKELDRVH